MHMMTCAASAFESVHVETDDNLDPKIAAPDICYLPSHVQTVDMLALKHEQTHALH